MLAHNSKQLIRAFSYAVGAILAVVYIDFLNTKAQITAVQSLFVLINMAIPILYIAVLSLCTNGIYSWSTTTYPAMQSANKFLYQLVSALAILLAIVSLLFLRSYVLLSNYGIWRGEILGTSTAFTSEFYYPEIADAIYLILTGVALILIVLLDNQYAFYAIGSILFVKVLLLLNVAYSAALLLLNSNLVISPLQDALACEAMLPVGGMLLLAAISFYWYTKHCLTGVQSPTALILVVACMIANDLFCHWLSGYYVPM